MAKDDLSAKWIFERILIVRVDSSGNVTIDSDNNTDIVKDVAAWAFNINAINDTTDPKLTISVVGEDNVNIRWGYDVETRAVTPYLGNTVSNT